MTEPELTDHEKEAFRIIANGINDDTANKLLDHHVGKTRRWMRWCAGNGYTPMLSDLVRQIIDADIPRKQMTVALATALWRLARRREADVEHERIESERRDRDS